MSGSLNLIVNANNPSKSLLVTPKKKITSTATVGAPKRPGSKRPAPNGLAPKKLVFDHVGDQVKKIAVDRSSSKGRVRKAVAKSRLPPKIVKLLRWRRKIAQMFRCPKVPIKNYYNNAQVEIKHLE